MQLANFTTHESHALVAPIKTPQTYKTPKMGIPTFPNFKPLELSDREEIESFVKQFPPYSDFNFVSLWSFNIMKKANVSLLNSNLVIKYHDYLTAEPFYGFLGVNKVAETANELLELSTSEGLPSVLKLVPEVAIIALGRIKHDLYISEDVSNHDYIYSIKEHKNLPGKSYSDKRTLLNRFKRRNSDFYFEEVDISDKNVQVEIVKFYKTWLDEKNIDKSEIRHEFKALQNFMHTIDHEEIFTLFYYANNNLVGFSISQKIHNNHVIVHFEKIDVSVPGISAFVRSEFAKYVDMLGFFYINYEQDLGISGLRKAKQLWNPITMLRKYVIYRG